MKDTIVHLKLHKYDLLPLCGWVGIYSASFRTYRFGMRLKKGERPCKRCVSILNKGKK
jgi:hypothetical protein